MLINRSLELNTVEIQAGFENRVSKALVAVNERMVAHEGEGQGRALVENSGIEVALTEGHLWLGQSGLQRWEVAQTLRATARLDDPPVKPEDLRQ